MMNLPPIGCYSSRYSTQAAGGAIFMRSPDVLHLQLKRFKDDDMRDNMVKTNEDHG